MKIVFLINALRQLRGGRGGVQCNPAQMKKRGLIQPGEERRDERREREREGKREGKEGKRRGRKKRRERRDLKGCKTMSSA